MCQYHPKKVGMRVWAAAVGKGLDLQVKSSFTFCTLILVYSSLWSIYYVIFSCRFATRVFESFHRAPLSLSNLLLRLFYTENSS